MWIPRVQNRSAWGIGACRGRGFVVNSSSGILYLIFIYDMIKIKANFAIKEISYLKKEGIYYNVQRKRIQARSDNQIS